MNRLITFFKRIKRKLKFRSRVRNFIGAIIETYRLIKFQKNTIGRKRVFYLGRTENNNLGDNGQLYCIMNWIRRNYADYELYTAPSSHISSNTILWLRKFKNYFDYEKDIIVFQSGYSTQDLGGDHPKMHELICEHLSNARILMMPQTIFFSMRKTNNA